MHVVRDVVKARAMKTSCLGLEERQRAKPQCVVGECCNDGSKEKLFTMTLGTHGRLIESILWRVSLRQEQQKDTWILGTERESVVGGVLKTGTAQ